VRQPLSILIVEDDLAMGQMLVDFLELAGFAPLHVDDVDEASALLEEGAFRAVVSDVHLGEKDGLILLEAPRVRSDDVPVILMSAFASPQTAHRAREAGAADFLVKPFEPQRLLDALARLLERD
jgi:two-component system response regulator FlrC